MPEGKSRKDGLSKGKRQAGQDKQPPAEDVKPTGNAKPDDGNLSSQMMMWQALVESREGLTVEELAAMCGCSRRTVQRHLQAFRGLGDGLVETVGGHGRKAFRMVTASPEMMLAFDEIVAVYVGRRFMEPMMGTFLWRAMQRALAKMRNHLGASMIRHFERAIGVIEPTMFGRGDYEKAAATIDELNQAIEEKRRVTMLYQSAQATKPSPVSVDPYVLVYNDGSLYLIGHSHKRGQIRVWKIDRVHGVTVTNDTFAPPADFEPTEHLRDAFGIFKTTAATPPQSVRIRFHPNYARQIREKRWHATERYRDQPDGSVILEMQIPELAPLKRWITGFGRYAEVLEPAELREMIQKELELTLEHYAK